MSEILDKINTTKDIKKLDIQDKNKLAEEIRTLIIDTVSKTGGHLASNLGVVELTIALHDVFDTPKDKMIWDVGHQCYVHKILTGRKDKMDTLRKFGGIAGFPKTEESEYDSFNTGHSSTSISVGAGMARARDILKKDYNVISVIGDGSLTGGMALEALNDVGSSNLNMTVILNDNEMSISKNVGGIPLLLSKIRTKRYYTESNKKIKDITLKIPVLGNIIIKIVHAIKRALKQIFIRNMFFEDIGFTYLGPVDGHNIEQLENVLKNSKKIKGPVLIHVVTKKGKGYKFAEDNPDKFHGISSFNIETGEKISKTKKDYSKVFGDKLIKLAQNNKRIVAVTAAMKDGTGLTEFAKKYPNRFFDVGIAEQHALGLVAGMSSAGLKPVLPIYSSFLQRGYDQLIHDIALQKLPVVIGIDRAGIVGNDGETHQGIFDLSFLETIPNMTIMAPKNFKELEKMLEFAVEFKDGPIAIRYPRGTEGRTKYKKCEKISLGKAEILSKGENLTIVAIGKMVDTAEEVRHILEKENIKAEIINVRFLKPLDEKTIIESIEKTKRVVTIEDNLLRGGLGAEILNLVNKHNLNVHVQSFGYDDIFVKQGTVEQIEEKYGLDSKSISNKLLEVINLVKN